MKTTITKKEASHFYQFLMSQSVGLYRGIKFAHAIARNLAFLKTPFNDMVKECLFDKDVNDFVNKWTHLDSEKMIIQMGIELEKDPSLKDMVEKATAKIKSNVTLLDSEIEVEIYQIQEDHLPEDIRVQDYAALKLMILIPEEKQP